MLDSPLALAAEKGVVLEEGLPAVYVEHADAVVIADVHLGYEEEMAGVGVFLPRAQLRRALELLESLATRHRGARLVIAGDLKHSFSRLLRQERLEVPRLLQRAQELGFREVIVVRGNHDNFVSHIVKAAGAEFLEDHLDLGKGVVVAHGHRDPQTSYELLLMGHEHPAIQVSMAGGRAKFPVFLAVPLEDGSEALVLPPAGAYQVGNVVSTIRENYLSPIIKEKGVVEEAVPVIVDEAGNMVLLKLSMLESILA